ncbi:hypothetical protein [Nocardia seriolae]|uniref:Uncharacterized protein n=2 Tax=Nocardia seriolae TaxID=37332 RepID=A0A0B8NDP5_9NOCA|nr:hypothetical protein [Nocardia seriolae]APA94388.1 hypothetical protein NS506_00304 [Nocardia seriolae]MTJ75456.1 hypothetical protein [Nocardia seriolae]MTJ84709.1 hypothetical protein [Nocardia seriolae]MTK38384.1 hypothetical protein [Nocardia seriolae]MTK45274.1 hypothetical protein [Nocardia seriolae]
MVFPVSFGWIQILLLVLAIGAIGLLITAVLKARKVGWRVLAGRGAGAIGVVLVAVVILWITTLLQTFLGLTGEVKAAHIEAKPIAGQEHMMNVDLTLYGDKDHGDQHKSYQVEGDMWVLQANIVELDAWVNALGFNSGYKVTRLYGQRLDGIATKQNQIFLNGSDADFFQDMKNRTWYTKPFVRSAYGNAVIATAGNYDVFISRDAIKTRPV